MTLAGMISTDEDALICDFAETYHIYDYKSLPADLAATLATGLRDDSRIKLKFSKQRISNTDLLLSVSADRLGLILSMLTGEPLTDYFSEQAFEDVHIPDHEEEVRKFDSIEEFENARNRMIRGE